MVVIRIVTFSLLTSMPCLAAQPDFDVLPRVCIAQQNTGCELALSASWQYEVAVCISTSVKIEQALHCQEGAGRYDWSAVMDENLTVYLLAQDTGVVLAKRQIKLMRPVEQPLSARRLSWSIF